jgi:hypothetical protein
VYSQDLFAGAGLTIYTYTQYNGILETNCTTYDDCYDILCTPTLPNDYLTTLKPNYWPGTCTKLNNTDNRLLNAQLYIKTTPYRIYYVSQLSIFLCNNCNATKIVYYGISC